MSDEEKPFEATPQRIEKAKREGNIARSSELAANLSFGAAAACVAAVAPALGAAARDAVSRGASGSVPWQTCGFVACVALVPLACAAVAGSAASVFQNGGFPFVSPSFKLQRLDPMEGLKRIASRETVTHALRAALAFVLAAMAMLSAIADAASRMVRAANPAGVAAAAWSAARAVAFAAVAIGLAFALAEHTAARRSWLRKLRMSLEERKRESKEQEGDPLARSRRRSLHRSLSRGAIAKVKAASFVVTNPTHVAVALDYRPPEVPVPQILVRALDAAALRVRELAAEHRVPVIENVALARALYRDGRVGESIPHAHYVAVAEIVAALTRGVRAS